MVRHFTHSGLTQIPRTCTCVRGAGERRGGKQGEEEEEVEKEGMRKRRSKGRRKDRRGGGGKRRSGKRRGRKGGERQREWRSKDKVGKEKKEQVIQHIQPAAIYVHSTFLCFEARGHSY